MTTEKKQLSTKMATMPINKLIITMAIPPIISMTIDGLYSTLDTIFVAAVNTESLVALSIALPFTSLIIAFAIGTANGSSSLIARYFGAKQPHLANEVAQIGILLAIMNWLLFSFGGLLLAKPFLELFTQNKEIIAMGANYIKVSTVFSLGFFVETTCSRYLQAMGETRLPMIAQLSGAIANCLIDPVLIFGLFGMPKLGLVGAAIGNVSGQSLAMVISFLALLLSKNELNLSVTNIKLRVVHIKSIYQLALPNIAMLSMPSLSVSIMNKIAAQLSVVMVAILGIIYKIQHQIEYPIVGLSQAVLPIFSFNFGAKNKERLLKAFKFSMKLTFLINAFFVIILVVFPDKVLILFSSSAIPSAKLAVIITSFSFLLNGLNFISQILFQSIGKANYSLATSLLKQLVFLVLLSLSLSALFGEIGLWLGYPLSELLTSLIFIPLAFKQLHKSFLNTEPENIAADD